MKTIHRGEIWQVRFEPFEGSEMGKTRPALVLQNDIGNRYAGTTIVAAITARVKDLPTLVDVAPSRENGLRRPCAVNLSHLRTISRSRLIARVGRIDNSYLSEIEQSTMISLGFRQ